MYSRVTALLVHADSIREMISINSKRLKLSSVIGSKVRGKRSRWKRRDIPDCAKGTLVRAILQMQPAVVAIPYSRYVQLEPLITGWR